MWLAYVLALVVGGGLLLVQAISGGHHDVETGAAPDVQHHGAGPGVLSLRSAIYGLFTFGFVGAALHIPRLATPGAALGLAVLSGLAAMVGAGLTFSRLGSADASGAASLGQATGRRARVLLACAQGERHVLGLQMACDVLEGAGYAIKHAGADLPAHALLTYAERDRPALVALACTGTWAAAADIRSAIGQLIEAQPDVCVVLGGAGWHGFDPPDPERVVRVDNMRDLLATARRLTANAF